MAFLWRVFCLTEGVYHFAVTPTLAEPTECPTDAGPIDVDATVLLGLSGPNGEFPSFFLAPAHHVEAALREEAGNPHTSFNSTSFETVGAFAYSGTDIWEAVNVVLVLSKSPSPSNSLRHNIRLYDITNNKAIAELGLTLLTTTPSVLTISSLSNLPPAPAVIEVQGQLETSSAPKGLISYVRLESESLGI